MSGQARAWIWTGDTEPSGLRLIEQDIPEPEPDQVVIRNHAIALNPVDWKCLEWNHPAWKNGHVPGVDGAGTVVAHGRQVDIPLGKRVAYHQDLLCNGSFATYTLVAARALLTLPEEVSFSLAASVPCPALTAWQAWMKVPAAANRAVLVIGGGAATGTYLTQLARQGGLTVWATASPKHRAALVETGVADVFDYRSSSWQEDLMSALQGRKLFAAFDTVGEQHARSLAPLLAYNGHLVCIQDRLTHPAVAPFTTAISQHEVALNAIHHYGGDRDWKELREAGTDILKRIASGKMTTPKLAGFNFEELPTALEILRRGEQEGKLVATLEA